MGRGGRAQQGIFLLRWAALGCCFGFSNQCMNASQGAAARRRQGRLRKGRRAWAAARPACATNTDSLAAAACASSLPHLLLAERRLQLFPQRRHLPSSKHVHAFIRCLYTPATCSGAACVTPQVKLSSYHRRARRRVRPACRGLHLELFTPTLNPPPRTSASAAAAALASAAPCCACAACSCDSSSATRACAAAAAASAAASCCACAAARSRSSSATRRSAEDDAPVAAASRSACRACSCRLRSATCRSAAALALITAACCCRAASASLAWRGGGAGKSCE